VDSPDSVASGMGMSIVSSGDKQMGMVGPGPMMGMSPGMSPGGMMVNAGPAGMGMALANGFGMTQRPMGMMGPGGMVGPNGVGVAGTGPQEWEWLTMSL